MLSVAGRWLLIVIDRTIQCCRHKNQPPCGHQLAWDTLPRHLCMMGMIVIDQSY